LHGQGLHDQLLQNSPRAGTQQGYVVVAVRCRILAFFCMKTSKVILVTGASSGIGRSIATHLASKGHKVYGTSRNPKNSVNTLGYTLLPFDATKEESAKALVDAILKEESSIDVLINNAGKGMTGAVEETPLTEARDLFELNYFGAIGLIQEVLPCMREQKSGLIVNITSIAGYMGLPYRAHYSAVKSALSMMTEGLRLEVKSFGIDVVNVAPGDFATNIAAGRYHAPLREESAYYSIYKNQLEQFDGHVTKAASPVAVAIAIEGILEKQNTKPHYFVASTLQKLSAQVLKKILPQRWYEKMLANYYKLPI